MAASTGGGAAYFEERSDEAARRSERISGFSAGFKWVGVLGCVRVRRPPIVGITSCLDEGAIFRPGSDYVYVNRSYVVATERAGAVPILVPLSAGLGVLDVVDALLLTGGDDIHPRYYGEEVLAPMKLESDRRIDFDRALLGTALARRIPVLAICYGMQLLNVHQGGTLIQQLPREPLDHGTPGSAQRHPVTITPDSLLATLYPGTNAIETVSSHRQAVARLGEGVVATAMAPDGVIEAIEIPTMGHVLGLEWHPEASPEGALVFDAFVRWSREKRA